MPADDPFRGVLSFFHTAELKSFGRAAERLGISTPAVSRAVSRLEERLGVKLLLRTSRSVSLTPEGALYQERCREALASLTAGRDALSSTRTVARGELRITLSPILGKPVLDGLGRFALRYPELRIRASMTDRFSRLHEENLDLAIRVGGRKDSSLLQRSLFSTRWVTVATPSYLRARGAPRSPSELARHNCLRFVSQQGKPRDFSFRDAETGRTVTHAVAGTLCIDQGDHLLNAALSGLGIAQVLDFMVEDLVRKGQLVAVLEAHSAEGPKVFALTPKERARSANVRAFLSFLLEELKRPRVEEASH
jgi:LysR family transcriptional regulator for bpeEF and oprC